MISYVKHAGLKIDSRLNKFLMAEILPGLDISEKSFWDGFAKTVEILAPRNRILLEKREFFQKQIDEWHSRRNGKDYNIIEHKKFLTEIGYIVPEGSDFKLTTSKIDPEISSIPGPQLVVPITNARYALNAVNARWGSLYDALYGTDMIDGERQSASYSEERGTKVVTWSKEFLDEFFRLKEISWKDLDDIELAESFLKNPNQYIGKLKKGILLKNNNLHVKIIVDRNNTIGANDRAGIANILVESAISVIMDCEDSVATVDVEDKIVAYRNWLGLMKGTLTEIVAKGAKQFVRSMNGDEIYETAAGLTGKIKGRSLMLVRNVGHLMTTNAILDGLGHNVGEGIMDAYFTTLCALHDLHGSRMNSVCGSVYIVKPKMHGPDEVELTDELFSNVEDTLKIPRNTIKIGIMDEERRTSLNLKECIRVAKSRVAFINTGFLDRTGDEIHTSMELGPFLPKALIKTEPWIEAYENRNVDIGLKCGLRGKAQIGKGMWAAPDQMKKMFDEKISHPASGANCAWVPSPTAATLHALHYHKINVMDRQLEIESSKIRNSIDELLDTPVFKGSNWSEAELIDEIKNNAQGILGYVVRWIDSGIGCSKVPDINNIGLMEDRATCRISSQHIANWIYHGVVSQENVLEIMKKMAKIVDNQNSGILNYEPMAPSFSGVAFKAACELVVNGRFQPSGYTEPILHLNREKRKQQ
jgi:malate synthase